jgi:endonuclease/exonuclease/phosphatase family metal-dependent hydrolase
VGGLGDESGIAQEMERSRAAARPTFPGDEPKEETMKKLWLLFASALLALPVAAGPPPPSIKVMTRNVVPGLDNAAPVVEAVASGDAFAIMLAVEQVWQEVVFSNIPARADALAAEIAAVRPDVVGLQEAALWRSEPGSDFTGIPDAWRVEYDVVKLLLAGLRERGLRYDVVAVTANFDLELPRLNLDGSGKPHPEDIRWTDRDVLLVRDGVEVLGADHGTFAAFLPLGYGIVIERGWVSADVAVRGIPLRLVSAHLEDMDLDTQLSQAAELLSVPGATSLPTVFIGDYNSNANPDPTSGAYQLLIGSGLTDAWTVAHAGDPGLTCCHDPLLSDPGTAFTQRVDLVLYRPSSAFGVLGAARTGLRPFEAVPPLWASDHAGVAVTLQIAD